MTPVFNVKFRIRRKDCPKHSLVFWPTYTRDTINIPDNIYEEYSRCLKPYYYCTDIISAYLIGWFYKHNEDIVHLDNVEEVFVENWDWNND